MEDDDRSKVFNDFSAAVARLVAVGMGDLSIEARQSVDDVLDKGGRMFLLVTCDPLAVFAQLDDDETTVELFRVAPEGSGTIN